MRSRHIEIHLVILFLVFCSSNCNIIKNIYDWYDEALKNLKKTLGLSVDETIGVSAFPFFISLMEPEKNATKHMYNSFKPPSESSYNYPYEPPGESYEPPGESYEPYESVSQSYDKMAYNPSYGQYVYRPHKEPLMGNGEQFSSIVMGEGRGDDDEEDIIKPQTGYNGNHHGHGKSYHVRKKVKMMAAHPVSNHWKDSFPVPIPKIEYDRQSRPYPTPKIDSIGKTKDRPFPEPIPKIPDDWTAVPWKTNRPCRPKDPCATKSRKPPKWPMPTVDWGWSPKPDFASSSEEKKPTGKRRCTVKVNCDGEWKRLRGVPGIGTCYSDRCINAKCSRHDLTKCSLTLRGAKQIIDCYGHYCMSICEGEYCIARCMGMYCEAKCTGHNCKANCVGWNCESNENGIVLKQLRVGNHHGVYGRASNDQHLEYVDTEFETDGPTAKSYNSTFSSTSSRVNRLLDIGLSQRSPF